MKNLIILTAISVSLFTIAVEAKPNRKPSNATETVSVLNCTIEKEQKKTTYNVRSDNSEPAKYESPGYEVKFFHYGDGFMMETFDKITMAEMSTQISPNQEGLFFMDLKTQGLREGTELLRIECKVQK